MFSYKSYLSLILPFKELLRGFKESVGSDSFVILRHDIEFDLERALELAQIENKAGIKSTYFIQVCSDAYNPASIHNQKIIQTIQSLDHNIGLHLYVSHLSKYDEFVFNKEAELQRLMLSKIADSNINIFSVHRPQKWFLEIREDYLSSMINAYGPSFFEYSKTPKNIKYYADSMHQWSYGEPALIKDFKKYQILIHPDEWYEEHNDLKQNYSLTFNAHCKRFNETLMLENKKFNELGSIKR